MPNTPYRPSGGLVSYIIPDPDFPRARRHLRYFDHDPCDDESYLETAFMDDAALLGDEMEHCP